MHEAVCYAAHVIRIGTCIIMQNTADIGTCIMKNTADIGKLHHYAEHGDIGTCIIMQNTADIGTCIIMQNTAT